MAALTAAWLAPGGKPVEPYTGEQTATGFATLDRRLRDTTAPAAATLVVLESTGVYVRRFTARAIPPAGRTGAEGYLWVND